MPDIHQIWHGDSRELCKVFNYVDCIITDPPFGVNNQSNSSVTQQGKAMARKIANDETPEIAIQTFQQVMDVLLPKTKPECDMYVFTSYQVLELWMAMTNEYMPRFGFQRKAVLTWEKDGPGMGDLNCPWGMGVEFILFFQKGPRAKDAQRRNTVLHHPQLRPEQLIHPHEKPGGLLEDLITTSTKRGDFLVDPFGGSGSLVRAARNCGRNAVAIEYDEKNYLIAKNALETQGGGFFS